MSDRIRDACGLRYSAHVLSRGNFALSSTSNIHARARQKVRGRRAGRASANDYDFGIEISSHLLSDRARYALEQPHVLPVRARQVENRRRASEIRQDN